MDTEMQLIQIPQRGYLSSYTTALSVAEAAVNSHKSYWAIIEACQTHLSGEKPIPSKVLKEKGMAWVANWNFNKAKGKISKGVTESCSRISDALSLGYVTFRQGEDEDAKDDLMSFLNNEAARGMMASAVGYALNSMLQQESRLSAWLSNAEYPAYAYGYCVAIRSEGDWMPNLIHPSHVAFRPETEFNEVENWITFETLSGSMLFQKWATLKNAQTEKLIDKSTGNTQEFTGDGWNLKGLEEVLIRIYQGRINEITPAVAWQDLYGKCYEDPTFIMQNLGVIKVAKIFWKELDGTISETYIPYANQWVNVEVDKHQKMAQGGVGSAGGVDILFQKNHGTFTQDQHIQFIRDSSFTESRYIQDCRGLAQFAVEDGIRYNRGRNGILNKMTISGNPVFEASASVSVDKFKLTVSQGYSIMPAGYQVASNQPNYNVSEQIGMLRFEEGEYLRETDQFDASIQGKISSRPNKDEVRAASAQVSAIKGSRDAIKFRDYANLFHQVIQRLATESYIKTDKGYQGRKRFFDLFLKTLSLTIGNVVKTQVDAIKVLKAVDSFVINPVIQDIETITMAIQMAQTPFARNRFQRMLLLAKGLPIEEVDAAVPLIADKMQDVSDQRMALFENDCFWNGNDMVVSMADDHIIHLTTHMQKAVQMVQGVQQQSIAPDKASAYLINLMAHIGQHIQALAQDPILHDKAKDYMAQFKQLTDAVNQVHQVAQQYLQQQQAAQNQPAPLDAETQAEIQRKDALAQSKEQRTNWLTQQRTQQANDKIQTDLQIGLARVDADKQVKLAAAEQP